MVDNPNVKRSRKSVSVPDAQTPMIHGDFFDRVSGSTYKLKPEASKTLYVLVSLLANEFHMQRTSLKAKVDAEVSTTLQRQQYLQHAESSLRMLAERLLKSFRLMDLIAAQNVAGPLWDEAAARLVKDHSIKSA